MQVTQQQAEQAASLLGCDVNELNPFDLGSIVSSKARNFPPQKIVIYGTPGIGKTTFAATFPKPILLRTEDGASAQDIQTFPKVATSLEEVRQALRVLYKGGHDFKTLILDSLDWMEPLVFDEVCTEGSTPTSKKEKIEDFGYGKGYSNAKEKWRDILDILEMVKSRTKMNVVAVAHAVAATVDLPDLDPYQRYTLKLNKHGSALWMEWADMILFVNYKAHVLKDADNKSAKGKARGSGERVIYTQERPAYQAKSRWGLDEEIRIGNDPTWSAFHENLIEASEGAYSHA